MSIAVVINNLNHSYGLRPVLNDISVSIFQEDFFIIIGPNGSGKTTLMKILAGIEPFQKGRVDILEKPVRHYTKKSLAKIIAFVPQTFSIDFPYTVKEMVLMGRYPHQGMLGIENEKDRSIAKEAMTITGVEDLADRKLDQISGGERQRVTIARAICQEPRIILMDEPTASLDLSHQIRIMDLMEQLKTEKGITIVMVSHDVNLAAMYADRLLILKNGHIVGAGRPAEVLNYDILEKTYGCTIIVDESPLGKVPRVSPVPLKFIKASRKRNGHFAEKQPDPEDGIPPR